MVKRYHCGHSSKLQKSAPRYCSDRYGICGSIHESKAPSIDHSTSYYDITTPCDSEEELQHGRSSVLNASIRDVRKISSARLDVYQVALADEDIAILSNCPGADDTKEHKRQGSALSTQLLITGADGASQTVSPSN